MSFQDKSENNGFGLPNTEFEPLEKRSTWPRRLLMLVLLVAGVGAGIYIWAPHVLPWSTPEAWEQDTPVLEEQSFQDFTTSFAKPEAQPAETPQPSPQKQPVERPTKPQLIEKPTGKHYVIVGSFMDDDLARDFAHKLYGQGHSCYIIAPRGKRMYWSVAVYRSSHTHQASTKKAHFQQAYGREVWVLYY